VASTTQVQGLSIAGSIAIHAAIVGLFTWAAIRVLEAHPGAGNATGALVATEPGGPLTNVDLEPAVADGVSRTEESLVPNRDVPHPQGGDVLARLDTGALGRGGEAHVALPALNLADGDERLRLSPDLRSHLEGDQLQRLRVASGRASWEDRRSTTHPMELTLVVTGDGDVVERRPVAPTLPSRGALASPVSRAKGGEIGSNATTEAGGSGSRRGGLHEGARDGAPGVGMATGRPGDDQRASAPVATARPDVDQAPVAVPANEAARPKDDVNSEQQVSTSDRAIVHASTAGGEKGEGQGGTAGGGDPAAGGTSGPGSQAHPLGVGDSDVLDFGTSDPRFLAYFRQIHSKLDPLWANAFPKSALLELKQGMVIIEFTISADGRATVSWPPARPSGIDEFDRNCADAIRRASPFPPIPPALGLRTLRIRAPFSANNPMVK
jgi:TonB family protein